MHHCHIKACTVFAKSIVAAIPSERSHPFSNQHLNSLVWPSMLCIN